jgi:hypothetical protein
MTEQAESTALVAQDAKPPAKAPAKVAADNSGILAIIPRDLEESWRYSAALIKGNMVPNGFRQGGKAEGAINPSLVVAGVMKSLELGMAPLTGLAHLVPINGRFTVYGDGAQGLVAKSGQLEDYLVETIGPDFDKDTTALAKWPQGYGYRVTMKRRGTARPFIAEFTVADAVRAGLWEKFGPWKLYPDRMLFNRARAFATRDGFADTLVGLGIFEELVDTVPARKQLADNSALDDDLTEQEIATQDPDKLPGLVDEYIAGLERQVTLEGLAAYQMQDSNLRMLRQVSESDEDQYQRAVTAGAKRMAELEASEAAAWRAEQAKALEAEIQEIEADAELDPDRLREDRDERRALDAEDGPQGDLLGDEK